MTDMNIQDAKWEYMISLLTGNHYSAFVTEEIASSIVEEVGAVVGSKKYMKLSERLYTPTQSDLFDGK